jgi:hypothetical protein
MRLRYLLTAAAFALLSSSAMAVPLSTNGEVGGGIAVIPVHDGNCHSGWRTHGGAYPRHRHDEYCDVEYDDDDDDYDDCHREVLRHHLSGYGKVWHKHRGSSCRVEIYEREEGPTEGYGGCIRVGPAVICGGGD